MLTKINGWLACRVLKSHDWTCAAKQGIQPTKEQIRLAAEENSLEGFYDYAKMYCSRCGKIAEESLSNIAQARGERWSRR
jgi:hypothetical protein